MTESIETGAQDACELEKIIATSELVARPPGISRRSIESLVLVRLTRELSKSPQRFFQTLVETAKELSGADSTGISLLDKEKLRFVWPAVAGPLKGYLWEGTPREFGPCGTVLDRNSAILFIHPERYFKYLEPISPSLEEVLLVPFHVKGEAVGTIWAVLHSKDRHFSAEDQRLLMSLSEFAASAYRVLLETGDLQAVLASAKSN